MDLTLLTPAAAAVGLLVVLPLAALAVGARRVWRVAAALALPEPPRATAVAAALTAAAILVAAAAAQPVLERGGVGRSLPSAEVMVVVDTSRSMLARPGPEETTRFERARAAALELRGGLGDEVPVGLASMTDRVLPHLFPSRDARAFRTTLEKAVGVDRPPPSVRKVTATTLDALASLATRNFFDVPTDTRVAVVLSDFESEPFAPSDVGTLFAKERVRVVLVRYGSLAERVFETPEDARYAPDPRAPDAVARLAQATGGSSFTEAELDEAAGAVRGALDAAPRVEAAEEQASTALAPWLALGALLPVAFVVRRRNRV